MGNCPHILIKTKLNGGGGGIEHNDKNHGPTGCMWQPNVVQLNWNEEAVEKQI